MTTDGPTPAPSSVKRRQSGSDGRPVSIANVHNSSRSSWVSAAHVRAYDSAFSSALTGLSLHEGPRSNLAFVEPRPCLVFDGDDRWPGYVLAWVHDLNGWHAVVRYAKASPEGWPMTDEHSVPASVLEPR